MWEDIIRIFVQIALGFLAGMSIWVVARKKTKKVTKTLREMCDVADKVIDYTASGSEDGVKFSQAEWEDIKKEFKEAVDAAKEIAKKE